MGLAAELANGECMARFVDEFQQGDADIEGRKRGEG